MPRGKPSPKVTITVDPDVHEAMVRAATEAGMTVSAWMTNAARDALRRADGLAAVAEWEARHGKLSESEMTAARRRMGARLREPAKTARRSA